MSGELASCPRALCRRPTTSPSIVDSLAMSSPRKFVLDLAAVLKLSSTNELKSVSEEDGKAADRLVSPSALPPSTASFLTLGPSQFFEASSSTSLRSYAVSQTSFPSP